MASRSARSAPLASYVLHHYDWSESSLILDVFTREQGRIAVAAKGAKRPFSQLRSVLLPFQRLNISLGQQPAADESREVHTLRAAEWAGGHAMLTGAALFSGFYLNELLMKLLARHDPHAALFDAYAATVAGLAQGDESATQTALRAFELVLLKEIGLLPDLGIETASRQVTAAGRRYRVLADAGVVESDGGGDGEAGATTDGATLLALQRALEGGDLAALQRATAGALAELRSLLRAQLHYHLGTSQLRTRQVMIEAQALDPPMNPLVTTGTDKRRRPTALSVNVNKIALLRNQRASTIPSVVELARIALDAGAHGITVHPRPDERHVRAGDVLALAALLKDSPEAEFNIEGNPFHNLLPIVRELRPQQCTFVPDSAEQSTSDHGWDLAAKRRLAPLIAEARALGVRVSLFMDAEVGRWRARGDRRRSRRALHRAVRERLEHAAASGPRAGALWCRRGGGAADGLGVNAGHDLNRANLGAFLSGVPGVLEVSIGHALIADALSSAWPRPCEPTGA